MAEKILRDHYVLFMPVDPKTTPSGWWIRVLHKSARHCFVVREESPGVWLSLDPQYSSCDMEAASLGFNAVNSYVDIGYTAVRVKIFHDPATTWVRGWLTCVSLAKYVTGFRCWWAVTPHQLLRALERAGHEVTRPNGRRKEDPERQGNLDGSPCAYPARAEAAD